MQQTNEALQQLKNVHVVTDADQVRCPRRQVNDLIAAVLVET